MTGCGTNPQENARPGDTGREYPSQEGWHSVYRITRAGRPRAVIRYGHMVKFDSRAIYYFDEGVQVDFFDEAGRRVSVLTAERGTYYEQTRDVFGTGNVVIVSDTGVTVMTEKIRWDEQRGKIISDTLSTLIRQDGDTIRCQGFEALPDLSRIVLRGATGTSGRRIDFDRIESELGGAHETDSIHVPVHRDSTGQIDRPDTTGGENVVR